MEDRPSPPRTDAFLHPSHGATFGSAERHRPSWQLFNVLFFFSGPRPKMAAPPPAYNPAAQSPPAGGFCGKCGAPRGPGKFCASCGEAFAGAVDVAPIAQAAPVPVPTQAVMAQPGSHMQCRCPAQCELHPAWRDPRNPPKVNTVLLNTDGKYAEDDTGSDLCLSLSHHERSQLGSPWYRCCLCAFMHPPA